MSLWLARFANHPPMTHIIGATRRAANRLAAGNFMLVAIDMN